MTDHEKAAYVTQLVCATINLDHAARHLQEHRPFGGNAKRRLNLLVNAADAFLCEAIKAFDGHDVDSTNALSEVASLHQVLLFQCSPRQIEAALTHLKGMVESNGLAYVPAPVAAASPVHQLQAKYAKA